MKVCLLAIAKNEDKYIDEWVNYHLSLGFDDIYILDNNDVGNELNIKKKHLFIIPYNGISFRDPGEGYPNKQMDIKQGEAYNYALKSIKKKGYTHLMVLDIDEFLELKDCDNVKDFIHKYMELSDKPICGIVWEVYDDNDIIYEKDCKESVIETYTRIQTKMEPYVYNKNQVSYVKSLIELHKDTYYKSPHFPDGYIENNISPNIAVVRHYRTKCLETFIRNKIIKNKSNLYDFGKNVFKFYFSINKINTEKIKAFIKIYKEYKS